MNRRAFLKISAAAVAGATCLPRGLAAASGADDRVLVLIELSGGNDGLNTVIPYADPIYRKARPGLAIPREQVLRLDERLGLHPALEDLMPLWRDREMAIVQGVGYPRPNRSHFRSIEIWHTASDAEETLQDGWLARAFAEGGAAGASAADAIVLGGSDAPVAGAGMTSVVMHEPDRFLQRARNTRGRGEAGANPALEHLIAVRANVRLAAEDIGDRLRTAPALSGEFPQGRLGQQLEVAARLVAGRVPTRVIKLAHSGFDTHAGQARRHRQRLRDLAQGLAAFRQALAAADQWDRVLVMTYAEFGRRVAENASGGTDHGAAAPHFVLGGRVHGGFHGEQPPLDDLDTGDLGFRVDFRRMYGTAVQWLGLPPTPDTLGRHPPLSLVG